MQGRITKGDVGDGGADTDGKGIHLLLLCFRMTISCPLHNNHA